MGLSHFLLARRSTMATLHPADAGLNLQPSRNFLQAYWRSINLAQAYGFDYRGMASGFASFYKEAPDLRVKFYISALDANPCRGIVTTCAPSGTLCMDVPEELVQLVVAEFSDYPRDNFKFSSLDEAQTATLRSVALLERVERILRGGS